VAFHLHHHHCPHAGGGLVAAKLHGEAEDDASGDKPVDARLDGRPRDAKLARQACHRQPCVVTKQGDQLAVEIVHCRFRPYILINCAFQIALSYDHIDTFPTIRHPAGVASSAPGALTWNDPPVSGVSSMRRVVAWRDSPKG
jgi:hypothetical protein